MKEATLHGMPASPEAAAAVVRLRDARHPAIGIILGSGLGGVASLMVDAVVIGYEDIPGMPRTTVQSHAGRLVIGTIADTCCVVLQGRAHFYEGHSMADVTFATRMLGALGVRAIVVTNASGGINRGYAAGDVMLIADHIFLPGLAGHHPLRGPNDDTVGERFPAIVDAYTPALRAIARAHATEAGLPWHEGTYAMVSGPSFETSAELRLLEVVGADAVGMSTCPEVVVARHAGIPVLGISLVANLARPDEPEILTHEGVLAGMRAGADHVSALLVRALPEIAAAVGATRDNRGG
jgi:purine-nucleoside phosphorylase